MRLIIGIVGEKARADEHARALAQLPGDRVAAIRCHPEDLDQLLQRAEVQAVDLCVGIPAQTELGIRVAQAGKHVIAALPVASSLADLHALTSTCQEVGVRLFVTGTAEYSGLMHALDNALASGQIGAPVALRLVWLEPANQKSAGKFDEELVCLSARALYIAQHIFGSTAERVYAQRINGAHRGEDLVQYTHIMLTFAENATAVLELRCGADNHNYRMLMLLGTQGAAYYSQPEEGVVLSGSHSHVVDAPNTLEYVEEWQAIIESIQSGEKATSDAHALVACLAATTAARLSYDRNEAVRPAELVQQGILS
jgi:predicted dehydrogenase